MSLKKLIDLDLLDRFLDKVKALIPSAATNNPYSLGTATVGSSNKYAREDHVHPSTGLVTDIQYNSTSGTIRKVKNGAIADVVSVATLQNAMSVFTLVADGTELQANTNLDACKTPGNYYCTSKTIAETIVNGPPNCSYYKLIVFRNEGSSTAAYSTRGYYQIAFTYSADSPAFVLIRALTTAGWTDWKDISNAATVNGHTVESDVPVDAFLKNILAASSRTLIPDDGDLNNFTTAGTYYASGNYSQSITNAPTSALVYEPFYLYVVQGSGPYNDNGCYQIAFPSDLNVNSDVYIRRYSPYLETSVQGYDGPVWSDWINVRNPQTVNGHTVQSDVPANAVFTDTTYTPASADPLMDGTAAVGTSDAYAREDHVHPSDDSRFGLDFSGTEIPADSNLNNYRTPGNYYCLSANASTITNTPVSSNDFRLVVAKASPASTMNGVVYQFVFGGSTTNYTIYFRCRKMDLTWTSWVDLKEQPAAATASPQKISTSSSVGDSPKYARQDHVHAIDLATGDANGQVKIAGMNVDVKGLNGHSIQSDVPANAVFTDTTYESKSASSGGTALSLVTTGEKYTWNQKGNGTITGITMNGSSLGTSGAVDLGAVFGLDNSGITIPANSNLNDYVTPGTYMCSNISSLTNCPPYYGSNTVKIIVFTGNPGVYNAHIYQMVFGDCNSHICLRCRDYLNAWTDWQYLTNNNLYYTSVPVSAATSGQIMRIPSSGVDYDILENSIVLSCTFADPSKITSDVTWSSNLGYITFTGTCTAATSADVILGRKNN